MAQLPPRLGNPTRHCRRCLFTPFKSAVNNAKGMSPAMKLEPGSRKSEACLKEFSKEVRHADVRRLLLTPLGRRPHPYSSTLYTILIYTVSQRFCVLLRLPTTVFSCTHFNPLSYTCSPPLSAQTLKNGYL